MFSKFVQTFKNNSQKYVYFKKQRKNNNTREIKHLSMNTFYGRQSTILSCTYP